MLTGDILRSIHPHGEGGDIKDATFEAIPQGNVTTVEPGGMKQVGDLIREVVSDLAAGIISRWQRHAELPEGCSIPPQAPLDTSGGL